MNSLYLNVLWKSDQKLKQQKGIKTFRWKSSDQQPNSLSETFWELQTAVRLSTFIECKKLELFLRGLDFIEYQCLVDAPGFFSDRLFLELMRALASWPPSRLNDQRIVLLQRLEPLQSMLCRPIWTENLLYTYLGILDYRLAHLRVPIGKIKKFSGWVRNSSAVGSKSQSGLTFLEPEIQERLTSIEFDYYTYFTSNTAAFDDLGVSAGTLLYTLLRKSFSERSPLNDNILKLIR